ncbi:carbohydrate-binding module family 13 protein [Trichoderma sp. SZMC 28013]
MAATDTGKIYVIKNSYTAANKILAMTSSGDSLSMIDTHSVNSYALWFLTPTTMRNYYRLHTVANGVKLSLDVINDGVENINLHMTDTGNYSGQFWRFDNWTPGGQGYPHRLSNTFTGQDKYLDVYSDTFVAHLAGGNHSGQHWELIPASTVMAHTNTSTTS